MSHPTAVAETSTTQIHQSISIIPLNLRYLLPLVTTAALVFIGYLVWREANLPLRYASLGFTLVDDDFARPPDYHDDFSVEQLSQYLGETRARLFAQLDRDGNGRISISEFEVLVHALRDNPRRILLAERENQSTVSTSQPSPGDLPLLVVVDNFTIYENDDLSQSVDALQHEELQWGGRLFPLGTQNRTIPISTLAHAFLPFPLGPHDSPSTQENLAPGAVFPLMELGPIFPPHLTPKYRFFPGPYFHPREKALNELVSLFHPTRAFYHSRQSNVPPMAVLVALSERYYHLAFRLLVEFQLSNTSSPLWITADSLVGDIIISKDGREVPHFSLHQDTHMIVISHFHPNGPVRSSSGQLRLEMTSKHSQQISNIKWNQSMPLPDALHHLSLQTFPIREMPFMDFDAFHQHLVKKYDKNAFSNRKYHILVTMGNLMDHTCHSVCVDVRNTILHSRVRPILQNGWNNVWVNTLVFLKKWNEMASSSNQSTNYIFRFLMETIKEELQNGPVAVVSVSLNEHERFVQIRTLSKLEQRLEMVKTKTRKSYMEPPSWLDILFRPPEEIKFHDNTAELYANFLMNRDLDM